MKIMRSWTFVICCVALLSASSLAICQEDDAQEGEATAELVS